jgi:hypothetical protein
MLQELLLPLPTMASVVLVLHHTQEFFQLGC